MTGYSRFVARQCCDPSGHYSPFQCKREHRQTTWHKQNRTVAPIHFEKSEWTTYHENLRRSSHKNWQDGAPCVHGLLGSYHVQTVLGDRACQSHQSVQDGLLELKKWLRTRIATPPWAVVLWTVPSARWAWPIVGAPQRTDQPRSKGHGKDGFEPQHSL